MLVHKRTRRLGMAFRADGILVRAPLQKLVLKGAVGIMAIRALDQAFVYPVVKGKFKCRPCIGMTLIADVRLLGFEKFRLRVGMMDAVAARAASARIAMGRPLKAWMG